MASKYGDMVALLEWAMKQKEPRITKKRRVKDVPLEDLNLVELLRRKQNEAKMLADFLNDHEKLHKKVKEVLADGKTEFKFYALGVGVVREVVSDGEVVLLSHATR